MIPSGFRYLDVEQLIEVVEADGRADQRVLEVHIPQQKLPEPRRPEEQDAVAGTGRYDAEGFGVPGVFAQYPTLLTHPEIGAVRASGPHPTDTRAGVQEQPAWVSSTTVYGLPDQTCPRDISRSSM